jgi:hypothetical protein
MMASERMTLVEAIEYIRNNEAHDAALAELKEVRDTLRWLLESKGAYLFHEDECPWQYGPDDCTCRVSRARQLAERLRVDNTARKDD